ncbi:hypothetical protein [Novosphingobium gossypii]|uniref:hypothetical protein n=1 Tax=Novosphingobium gossypii TaxID=1604774 RepID=UPI003D1EB8D0
MIGAAKDACTFTEPYRARPSRVMMVHQHRVINDYPLPKCVAAWLNPDIALHWVLDAVTEVTDIPIMKEGEPEPERDRQGLLRGTVRMLSYLENKRLRQTQTALLKEVNRKLNIRSYDPDINGDAEATDRTIDAHRIEIMGCVEDAGPAIVLQFALMRTGECRVWYDAQPGDVGAAGTPAAHIEKQLDWLAAQAYYFIKDVVHDHTHHDATSDQITPLFRFDSSRKERDHSDEIAWRRETLWSLSREIERLNREGGLTDQRKALGIIAYAEAFQASLMGHVRTQGEGQRFEKSTSVHDYDFKHLKDSIKASIDVNATRLTQKIQIAIAAPTIFIATTALVSSLVSAHNGSMPPLVKGAAWDRTTLGAVDPWLPWLAANPALTGFAVMICLLMAIAYFLLDGRAGIYNAGQRMLSQFGRALAVTLFGSLLWQWLFLLFYHLLLVAAAFALTMLCFFTVMGAVTT